MAQVLALARRVEPNARAELDLPSSRARSPRAPRRSRGPRSRTSPRRSGPSDSPPSPSGNWSGRIPIIRQVRAVDALVALGDHRPDAEQVRPLRRPVARRARAVLLAREHDQRRALVEVALDASKIVISSPLGRCTVHVPRCPGTSRLRSRTLANVPRTITSWLPRREPYELKSLRSTPCSIRYGRPGESGLIAPAGEMWSVVTESPTMTRQRAPRRPRPAGSAACRRSTAGGARRSSRDPRRRAPLGYVERAPVLVAREDVGVRPLEHLAAHGLGDRLLDLLAGSARCRGGRRPPSQRLVDEVDVHPSRRARRRRRAAATRGSSPSPPGGCAPRSCGCPRAPSRRRGRLGDGLGDRLGQRPGVADARRAAVADGVEAELLEVARQPGALVVLGHDLRARREARLHPRLARRARARPPSSRAGRRRPSPAGSTCSCSS